MFLIAVVHCNYIKRAINKPTKFKVEYDKVGSLLNMILYLSLIKKNGVESSYSDFK